MEKMISKKIIKYLLVLATVFILLFFYVKTSPYKYDEIVSEKFLSPSLKHILGTDYIGRDFMVRICFAIINTLIIAVSAIVFNVFLGGFLGIYAGHKGGKTQKIFLTIINIIDGVPLFLVATTMLIFLNSIMPNLSILGIVITLFLTSWTRISRVALIQTMKIKNTEYVYYAIKNGATFKHLFKYHYYPNVKDVILISALQQMPKAIQIESFLSFVGIGIQPPLPSLGKMINEGIKFYRIVPLQLLTPCFVLIFVVLTFNCIGENYLKEYEDSNYEK